LIERGKSAPRSTTLDLLARALEIDGDTELARISALLRGPDLSATALRVSEAEARYDRRDPFIRIPRLPITLAAGAPRLDVTDGPGEPYAFREDFFGPRGLDPDHCRVAPLASGHHGESMRETMQPGAMLLLDLRPVTSVAHDALYVVRAPDEEGVTVKRCALRGDQLVCKPDNPQHTPFAIDLRRVELPKVLLARVVWWANEDPALAKRPQKARQ